MPKLVGWSDILSSHGTEYLTNTQKQEIVKTIRRRHYNFTYFDHQNMSYCCPFFDDGYMVVLSKKQFDDIMAEAYEEMSIGQRLLPMDAIKSKPINEVLFEKEEYVKDVKWNG